MELSEIRKHIDEVDDQLLQLFLQRMDLADQVAAYKNEHHLPILNRERERAVLAKVTEQAGERERYAYHLFSTLFELARSRQAELISAPTRVAAQVKASLEAGSAVFPQTGLIACQGVGGRPTPRPPATVCCPGATSSMSRPSRPWPQPWSPACASSACCPLKTVPTAPSGPSMSCSRTTASAWCAPPAVHPA